MTAHVQDLEFSSNKKNENTSAYAMEALVEQLDDHRGVVLTSSYEFPGRYARWSLGFVDPPLEISGRGQDLKICALNARGRLILPAIETAMKNLKEQGILSSVTSGVSADLEGTGDKLDGMPTQIHVRVVPPPSVGTFSEEERSRQVSLSYCMYMVEVTVFMAYSLITIHCIHDSHRYFPLFVPWST